MIKKIFQGLAFFCCNHIIEALPDSTNQIAIINRIPDSGFFSNFFCILGGIEKAEEKGFVPVVDMTSCKNRYRDDKMINGIDNAWEYFFFQPCDVNLQKAYEIDTNPLILNCHEPITKATTVLPTQVNLERGKKLIHKYIKFKDEIIDALNQKFPNGFDPLVLGIHVRGSDRRWGTQGHLITAEAHDYLQKARELDEKNHYKFIFLACDETDTIEMFLAVFKDRLIINDAYRVSVESKKIVHANVADIRAYHKYLLGKEILLDCLMLSLCGHFMFGPSNVAHAAMMFSPSPQKLYPIDGPGFYNP